MWNYRQIWAEVLRYLEVLPLKFAATKLEADAFGLDDFERLEIFSHGTILFGDEARQVLIDLVL